MDTLCGIGLPELLVLALLAFILLGPERTREVALTLGRWLGGAMRSGWWREAQAIANAARDLPGALVRMAELEEAQSDLKRTFAEIERAAHADPSHPDTPPETGPATSPGTPGEPPPA